MYVYSNTSNLKMGLIIGGLAALAFVAICVTIVVPTVAATNGHASSSSSTGSNMNNNHHLLS